MPDWIDRVLRMLGLVPAHGAAPDPEHEAQQEAAIAAAKRRVSALDVRVDVLTRRMNRHERQPHP